ncbi:MAG: PQQ-binding-like beta-propeller repeat protein [Verrucomicrobiota bacterium]|nr:PQQ-binding-like beta-propeller repeat protein [Verrucomicrobiota bacterium]
MKVLLSGTIALLVLNSSARADWPQFRGPDGQGVSTARNVPLKWGLKEGVAWKKKLPGKGWSSPVIGANKVIMTVAREDGKKVTLGVVAVDVQSGEIAWNRDLFTPDAGEVRKRHSKNGLASATPYLEEGVVYAHFGHMGSAALKLADGEVIWKETFNYPPVHGTGSSPVVVAGRMIFNADGASDPVIVALDRRKGEVAWKTPRRQKVKKTFSFGTPLVLEIDGRTQVISQASGKVAAYDPKDGSEIWMVRYGEGYSVVPRPVFANGLLYVATGFDRASLLGIRPQGAKGDVTDTHVVFKETRYIPKTPSFVESGGYLYLVDDTGSLTCRDAKSGELKWREKIPGNFSSSPVLIGNKLYLATEDGVAYVAEVSPKGGKIVFELEMEERIFASPALIDGALFLRSEEHLWKIGG